MLIWEGREVNTVGDLFDNAVQAMDYGKAQEFLAAYRAVNEHADDNLGHIFGYASSEDLRKRLHDAYHRN